MAMAKVMEVAKTAVSRQEAAAASLTPTSTPGLDLPTNPENATGRTAGRVDTAAPVSPLADVLTYQRDAWERWILFLDTLRQRADDLLVHDRAGKPPLLDFDYELVLDARRFEKPANYALLRITRVADDCIEDCLDPSKPPVIIVDPRAGQGPGIGGFKRESEVGIALHEGYPVYFVAFFPEPCPGQTIADVLHAMRRFVEEVAARHSGLPPILYGNCQAGWAITLLAADCEGLAGPIVLNGSPLSYWAGDSGTNPMRISGGLFGGAWPAHLVARGAAREQRDGREEAGGDGVRSRAALCRVRHWMGRPFERQRDFS